MRTCTICQSDARFEVDRQIVAGTPFRVIAADTGLSKSAIERHASDHVAALVMRADDIAQKINANSLVAELRTLREVVMGVLEEARADGEHALALSAVHRLEKQSELVARLLGELVERQRVETVDILFTERWQRLRPLLLHVLRNYPQAALAVEEALRDVGE